MIYDSLLMQNDQYFVLRDFDSYVNIQREVGHTYENHDQWLKMSLMNIAEWAISRAIVLLKSMQMKYGKLLE